MATLRERSPGVWQVRVFTGRNGAGRPTQVAVTVYGNKRDALRAAVTLESAPQRGAAGRTVGDVLRAWLEHKEGSYTPASLRDQTGRVRMIEADPIAKVAVARLGVADVDRWLTRMRRAGVGDAAAHNRHTALRAALHQAVVWGWITSNPAALTRPQRVKRPPREAMSPEEAIAVLKAATAIDERALTMRHCTARRVTELAGARHSRLPVRIGPAPSRLDAADPGAGEWPTTVARRATMQIYGP